MKNTTDKASLELAKELRLTGERLLDALAGFHEKQINIKPFAGSWTAGQVIDHILKSGNGAYEVLHGATKKQQRPYDEKVTELKTLFLDFSIQMQSPAEILPTESPLQKEQLQHSVQHMLSKLNQAAANLNLEESCLAFEFPGSGFLTRFEWLSFFMYHTQRHTRQLSNIHTTLLSKSLQNDAEIKPY